MSQQELEELRQLWTGLVAEFRASGLGQAEWCRQNGYNVRHLHYWLRKCASSSATAPDTTNWLPVAIGPDRDTDPSLIVRVGSAMIDVQPGFDPNLLRAIVRSLA